jgi:tetratricopeptide (TPR) repeat protein
LGGGYGEEYDRAIADFDHAIRLDPQNPRVYLSRAEAHFSKRAYDKAIADCNQAIRLDRYPDPERYRLRAQAHEARRNLECAPLSSM